jgi:dolichyl-diphosphooligosaccharide--protein glycosyltransferase
LGSDNDPLNTFFPLLIVLFFVYTLDAKDLKRRIIFGTLTGLAISLFAIAWQGWWFMFNFIIAALAIYGVFHIIRQLIKRKKITEIIRAKETKNFMTVFVSIVLSSAVFITIMHSFARFTSFLTGPLWFSKTKVAALGSYWPNVLVTVAEFNPGSLGTIVSQMGGKLLFFLGLMGVMFIITRKEEKIRKELKYIIAFGAVIYLLLISKYGLSLGPKIYMILLALPVVISLVILLKSEKAVDVKMAIFLVIWFIATTYAALKGVRFTLLMVSAFGVALGVTIAVIYRTVSKWIASELKINENITKTLVAVLLLLVLIAPVKAGLYTSTHFMPSVNDAWYNSLTNIRDNSEQTAIINSWWDFGHWFKYIAERRVTLDGSSQGGPPLHWLGKLMVTDDETHSVGILRMLDCGSNKAFDDLNGVLNDTPKSIKILDEVVTLEKKEAGQYLLDQGLTKEQATPVLKNTHCDPPENFFITSEDMIGKAGVWGHFGSWDFNRAEMHGRVKGTSAKEGRAILLEPRYNLTEEQADQYYYEIQTLQPCNAPQSDGMMVCNQALSNGQQLSMIVNLTNMDVTLATRDELKPVSVVHVTENGTVEKKFAGSTLQFSIVLIPTSGGKGYSTLIAHPYLANSMFTRLFYLGGHGLQYFDKFSDQRGVTGGRVIVWKVDWEGTDANAAYEKIEVEVEADDVAAILDSQEDSNETASEGSSKETNEE